MKSAAHGADRLKEEYIMLKILKTKGTEIRRAVECDDSGKIQRVVAVISQAAEMLKEDIIFRDNVSGNESKWLVITAFDQAKVYEYETKADAFDAVRLNKIPV